MDQAEVQRIQQELQELAGSLFPGTVRRAVVLRYGDDPVVEPGEVMVRLVASEQVSGDEEPAPAVGGPAMKQFRGEVSARLPEVRRIEVIAEDADGKRAKRFLIRVMPGEQPRPDTDLTPVMVRMRSAELEIIDTLISGGIAANRAEAVRWALARISERPAYAQLRAHTREIEQLRNGF